MSYQILTVGNPNCGKTTLFNSLTGARQQVGNWAGVTVEKKTGDYVCHGDLFTLTDLPGIYHLDSHSDANSLDEIIAARAVLDAKADLIVNVVDATSLERSLYTTLQLRELGRPMVVVLNKVDAMKRQQQRIDVSALSDALGCPVFAISANDLDAVTQLKASIHQCVAEGIQLEALALDYGSTVNDAIDALLPWVTGLPFPERSMALHLLENDRLIENRLITSQRDEVKAYRQALPDDFDAELAIADARYTFIHDLCLQVRSHEGKLSKRNAERLDQLMLHRVWGLPMFFLMMYLMFMFAINIGSAFIDFFDIAFGAIFVEGVHHLFDAFLPMWLVTLLADGVGAGIQTVATFIPVIASLYFALSIMESSGYIARAAFVLDKLMQKVGLPGKAFVPMVLGFGCTVPAVMATRTLDLERERKIAAAMSPFMSCGARLPVYALFAAAFFPSSGQNVVFLLYLIGISAAILTGLVLRKTLYPGNSDSFVMELPDYEMPTARNVLLKTWQKLKRFVLGAGKTIVLVIAVLSFLNSLGTDGTFGNEDSENSVLSRAAQVVTPVLAPIGVEQENWPATVGVITGIFAKEAVVGTLNSLYATDEEPNEGEFNLAERLSEAVASIGENLADLSFRDPLGVDVGELDDLDAVAEEQEVDTSVFSSLTTTFSAASAFAYLLFILLYTPCAAAMGAYVREFGRPFALFVGGWTLLVAYTAATFSYQLSMLAQHPMQSLSWCGLFTLLNILVYRLMKQAGERRVSWDFA
ncbi:Fe(2+) transporter permease subunit FeoB [Thaumasiovibrio subtropicus]|uniref:Fe(2+) transporter permease subunit FeoB n=1 Tax=Thaumasiovibrio subtropicus TaxID=1891207 RepID=UPI000B34D8CF|nr:Fe(2+) transporter permease subunit FeoB [Thaumasiovibrio subtropicus]